MKLGLLALAMIWGNMVFANPKAELSLAVGNPIYSDVARTQREFYPLAEFLSQELHRKVKLVVSESWDAMIESIGRRDVDMAIMAPMPYVMSHDQGGAQLIATLLSDGKPSFRGLITVCSRSRITTVEELRGKKFAFGNQKALSGYLVPLQYLRTKLHFIKPEDVFSTVTYGNPWAVMEDEVSRGIIDAAVDWDGNRQEMIDSGKLNPRDSRVIWESPPIPNDAFVVNLERSKDTEFVRSLRVALLKATIEVLPKHSTGFTEKGDNFYHKVRELIKEQF